MYPACSVAASGISFDFSNNATNRSASSVLTRMEIASTSALADTVNTKSAAVVAASLLFLIVRPQSASDYHADDRRRPHFDFDGSQLFCGAARRKRLGIAQDRRRDNRDNEADRENFDEGQRHPVERIFVIRFHFLKLGDLRRKRLAREPRRFFALDDLVDIRRHEGIIGGGEIGFPSPDIKNAGDDRDHQPQKKRGTEFDHPAALTVAIAFDAEENQRQRKDHDEIAEPQALAAMIGAEQDAGENRADDDRTGDGAVNECDFGHWGPLGAIGGRTIRGIARPPPSPKRVILLKSPGLRRKSWYQGEIARLLHRLGAPLDLQLFIKPGEVRLDGVRRKIEPARDFLVGASRGKEGQDFVFAIGDAQRDER